MQGRGRREGVGIDDKKIWHGIEIRKSDVEKRQRFDMEERQENLSWKKRLKPHMEKTLNVCFRGDSEIWYGSMTGRFDM